MLDAFRRGGGGTNRSSWKCYDKPTICRLGSISFFLSIAIFARVGGEKYFNYVFISGVYAL